MKHFLFSLLLCTAVAAAAQDPQVYLREANTCFDKGDYECAKTNYMAYVNIAGTTAADVSASIQKADECLRALITADAMYEDENYPIAKAKYELLLQLNPTDPHATNRLALCNQKIEATATLLISDNPVLQSIADNMIYVEGGTFTMGHSSESPAHSVTLSPFRISKYEVTQSQWREVTGSNPAHFGGCDDCPVENVSWNNVQEFITKLNSLTGKTYRLPTEAEWEFAARGGNKSQGHMYAGSSSNDYDFSKKKQDKYKMAYNIAKGVKDLNDIAWFDKNGESQTHPVGAKSPNELGLYDMSGNVCEWCNDFYDKYSPEAQSNPAGPAKGAYRVIRGGSWCDGARFCSVYSRHGISQGVKNFYIGLRLVMQ